MALGSTQPPRNEYQVYFQVGKGGRCVRLTTLTPFCAVAMKSGNLNFLEPLGHSRPVTGLLLHLQCSQPRIQRQSVQPTPHTTPIRICTPKFPAAQNPNLSPLSIQRHKVRRTTVALCVQSSLICALSDTTRPLPLPKRVLHTVPNNAFSFNFQYLLFPLKSSDSCLRLLPRLVTSIGPSGKKGPFLMPRCIGTVRARTQLLISQSNPPLPLCFLQ